MDHEELYGALNQINNLEIIFKSTLIKRGSNKSSNLERSVSARRSSETLVKPAALLLLLLLLLKTVGVGDGDDGRGER